VRAVSSGNAVLFFSFPPQRRSILKLFADWKA
jgi:hypothetical protein